jgi:hypothetical protein
LTKPVKEYTVQLTPEEAKLVRRPVVGEGGWQSLQKELQSRLKPDNKITLPKYLVQRARRYATEYGSGGWEQRLMYGILSAVERTGIDPANL